MLNEARKVDSMNCDVVNDDVTIINPLLGLLFVGQEKTGVQAGRTLPIFATAQNSN